MRHIHGIILVYGNDNRYHSIGYRRTLLMRPRIEGIEEEKVIKMIDDNYSHLSPTELIKQLINNHYKSLYPRGDQDYGNIETGEIRED